VIIFRKFSDMTIIVGFEQLTIHAPIGLYPEEKILGNTFLIYIQVALDIEDNVIISNIDQTIDYSRLVSISKEVFAKGGDLIETSAQQIIQLINEAFPHSKGVNLRIAKMRPATLPLLQNTLVQIETGYFEQSIK
jgi:dihydroneopterin aldolase